MKHISIISAILIIGTSVQLYAGEEAGSNTYYGLNAGNTGGGLANSFFGSSAGINNTGTGNTFNGYWSGVSNTTGSSNTFIGVQSGARNKIGNQNVFLGYDAGFNETGSNKLYIDSSSTRFPLIYGEFNNDLVRINGTFETTDTMTSKWAGSNYNGDGLSKLLLLEANNDVVELKSDVGFALRNARADFQWNFRTAEIVKGFIATKEGTGGAEFTISNTTDDYKNVILTLGNGAKNVSGVWINASSRALKENIKELSTQDALEAFHKLQPVTYNYKSDKKEQVVGFIAEDVPELVAIQGRDGLSAMDMVAVLTKVVQEQDKNMHNQAQVMAETRSELKAKDKKIATMEVMQKVQNKKIAKLEIMQKKVAQLEAILTNLTLDTSDVEKEKVSVSLK